MVDKPRVRNQNMMLRLNDDEREMIQALAGAWGLTMSDALRQCIRREAARVLGMKPGSVSLNAPPVRKAK